MIAATVTGNVGKDATTREYDGKPVLSFAVASRRFDKGTELTDWVDVSFWGERGRKLAQFVTKGSRVAVRGTVWQREYEHQGQKRSALTMRADDIELLGGAKRDDGGPRDDGGFADGGDDEVPF